MNFSWLGKKFSILTVFSSELLFLIKFWKCSSHEMLRRSSALKTIKFNEIVTWKAVQSPSFYLKKTHRIESSIDCVFSLFPSLFCVTLLPSRFRVRRVPLSPSSSRWHWKWKRWKVFSLAFWKFQVSGYRMRNPRKFKLQERLNKVEMLAREVEIWVTSLTLQKCNWKQLLIYALTNVRISSDELIAGDCGFLFRNLKLWEVFIQWRISWNFFGFPLENLFHF